MKSPKVKNLILAATVLSIMSAGAVHAGATRVAEAIWGHGQLYDTVVTPATFVAPPEHSTDLIYSFDMSGLLGQRSVADAAPGDREYNGGRWDVQIAVFTAEGLEVHDPDADGFINSEITSADQVLMLVDQGHLDVFPANFYFECPMLPRRR